MLELLLLSLRSSFLRFLFLPSLIFYIFIYSALANADSAAPDPKELITEMSNANSELNYDGVFVYRYDKQIDTMRIVHKKSNNGAIHERLIALTGNKREIIRDNDRVKYYFPENKVAIIEKSKPGQLISSYFPDSIQSISKFYIFNIAGQGRIAGLNAWIVNIMPIDRYRYGYQVWIDKESKLLLKSKLKNFQGVTLEQMMFTQISVLENINDTLLKTSFSEKDFTWINNIKDKDESNFYDNARKKWMPSWIPEGFLMSEYTIDPMPTSTIPVDHFIYTDGIATISIYVEKLNKQQPINMETTNFGGVNTYSISTNGYQITAVGEVPKATVQLIANSVKLSP